MKVCIDAGHNFGVYDTGAEGNGLKEQYITFGIAEMLKKMLAVGIDVVMTRNNVTDILGTNVNSSVNKRVAICNSNKRLYVNTLYTSIAEGTEVLVYKYGGQAEKLARKVLAELVNDLSLVKRCENIGGTQSQYWKQSTRSRFIAR